MQEPQPENPERARVYREMTPATQQVATDFEDKLCRQSRDGLLIRHEMGLTLAEVTEGRARYGSRAVEQLAAYLGLSPDRLYKLRTYARIYTRCEVEKWAGRRMSSGGRITFHHLAAIMVVQSADTRLGLVQRVFQDSLSVRAVRDKIAKQGCTKRKAGKGGRRPRSILGGLEQLISRSQTLTKAFAVWEEVVFEQLEHAEPAEIGAATRNRVVVAQNVLDELAGRIGAAMASLASNLQRVDQILCARDVTTAREAPAAGGRGRRR